MATKTKATKESVVKTEKKSVPPHDAATAKSKTAKSGELEDSVPAAAPVITPEPHPETGAKKTTKPAKIADPVVETVAAPVPAALVQDLRWQEIRLILEKLKDDTVREIRKSVKNGTEAVAAIEPGGDIYDQASSERDRELGLLLGDREREKIHSIDEALLRINDGEYGICEECDEDIPLGRLKAMPFTRHCVKCKSDLEKLQAQTKRVEEERAYREIPLGAEDEES
jgi:DnaK suppressor protein